jgi:hypothetical protein
MFICCPCGRTKIVPPLRSTRRKNTWRCTSACEEKYPLPLLPGELAPDTGVPPAPLSPSKRRFASG